jgi:hypothetical protein
MCECMCDVMRIQSCIQEVSIDLFLRAGLNPKKEKRARLAPRECQPCSEKLISGHEIIPSPRICPPSTQGVTEDLCSHQLRNAKHLFSDIGTHISHLYPTHKHTQLCITFISNTQTHTIMHHIYIQYTNTHNYASHLYPTQTHTITHAYRKKIWILQATNCKMPNVNKHTRIHVNNIYIYIHIYIYIY